MDGYEDYTWMKNDDETNSGFQDFFECISKITEKMDSAKSMMKDAKKKGVELTTDPQTLIDTGFTLTKPEIDLLSLEPDDIRDRYTDVVEFFEAFDEERAAHTSIKTRLSEGMLWGWWRDSYGDTCGLDGVVEFDVQRQGEIDNDIPNYGTRHGYGDETPVVDLELVPFTQTGVIYYVGAASFAEIDAVSRVPSYPNSVDDVTWSKRALQPSDADDQFQRPLDIGRMQDIQQFVRPFSNRILNAVILYIPPDSIEGEKASVKLDQNPDDARLVVDVGEFLETHDDGIRRTWGQDHPHPDLRPVMLLDGQHRTRGGAISPEGKDKKVPIVVLPPTFTLADAARVFTEINTGSEPLKPLLQLHLRHRFALASREIPKDFRDWTALDKADSRRQVCRANRLSYELSARCCGDPEGALYGRIRMMDVNSGATNVATKADVFHDIASGWFRSGAPFGSEEVDLDLAHRVVSDYFRAWQRVADHEDIEDIEPWSDTTNRWYPIPKKGVSGKPKAPYITMQIPFKAVMITFPLAYELASIKAYDGNPPGLDEFLEVLRPLHALDWTHVATIKDAYGLDKHTHLDLYNWFSWTLQDYSDNDILYPADQVWNPDDPDPALCKPGRGFFSPASPELVQIHPPGYLRLWPSPGDTLHFWSPLVPNTNRMVEWHLSVENVPEPATTKNEPFDGSLHAIKATKRLADAGQFAVSVFWRRSQSGRLDPPARRSLIFTKGEGGLITVTDDNGKSVVAAAPPDDLDELEAMDEGEYVIAADFGEGTIMPPPPPNQPRTPSGKTKAPARFRLPWCSACFFGFPECKAQHCAFRDQGIPEA
jgi:hypothetical protein